MIEQYKLILVDDEDDIRGRIHSMISADSGFEVVASASNGYDALELIEEHQPHAVITDIRMPYIDGLSLTHEIRNDFPNVKVVFLTGYGEFDYARKAVELDVVSYIMKPATKQDVLQALDKLKQQLDEEYGLIHNLELLEQNVQKNKQLFMERQLNLFLMQTELEPSDLLSLQMFGVSLESAEYTVGIIEFFNDVSVQDILRSETFIREYFDSVASSFEFILPFDTSEGLAFLIKGSELHRWEIEFVLSKLLKNKTEYDHVSVRIGLSQRFQDMTEFSMRYQEASSVLSVARFTNASQVIAYEDMEQTTTKQVTLTSETIRELEYTIRFENEASIHQLFDRLIAKLQQLNDSSLDHQLYIISIANIVMEYAASLGIDLQTHFKDGLLGHLLSMKSVEDILRFAEAEVLSMRHTTIDRANTKIEEIADRVCAYLERHFDDSQISLDAVADEMNISVSYLSSLLKKEKGITFNKLLIQLRINKAKELLKYSDLKVIEIAKKVGYNDVYYFSHSFKKNTSMSPKEYRDYEKTT